MKTILSTTITLLIVLSASMALAQNSAASTKVDRDPFWPAGFWPKDKDKPVVITSDTWPVLKVKGITKKSDGTYVAMIKDVKGWISAGETIEIERFRLIYRWKVFSISKKGINAKKLDIMKAENKKEQAIVKPGISKKRTNSNKLRK